MNGKARRSKVAATLTCLSLFLAGCSENSDQRVSSDINFACLMVDKSDDYKIGILMIIEAARSNPEIVKAGRGDPYRYIDRSVRNFKYPEMVDSPEAKKIKGDLADALDIFAAAHILDVDEVQVQASANLYDVTTELQAGCRDLIKSGKS